jgi:hypothetical protein
MAGTCGGPMMGGRRRKTRRTRKLKGGMGYGFGGNTIGSAGAVWDNSWGGEATADGTPVIPGEARAPSAVGGRRRRKSKKGSKKSRRTRKMKGGGSVANVGSGFTGAGARGIADAVGYPSNLPTNQFPIPTGTR